MKHLKKTFLFLITILILIFTTACAGKYPLSNCSSPIAQEKSDYSYKPYKKSLDFNRKTEEKGLTFYLEKDINGRNADSGIDRVKRAKDFCAIPPVIYLLKDGVTHVSSEGFWLNSEDSLELILAILLKNSAENKLPFGVFAGVSAALLKNETEFPVYSEKKFAKNMEKYPYVRDLQYPLFSNIYTKKPVRETAWNFALKIGEIWLQDHTASDLKQATKEDFSDAFSNLRVESTNFDCPVGDLFYPWQVVTDCFHYYIEADFQDLYFSKKEFTIDYPTIKSYVEENEKIVKENLALFGKSNFNERVDVFFGDFDFATPGGLAVIKDNAILIRTVSTTIHEMTHFILYQSVGNRYLSEGICECFNPSTYRRLAHYKMYKNSYPKNIFSEDIAGEFLPLARKLYNKNYGKTDFDRFDLFNWIDCLAASMCANRDWKIHNSIQHASFFRFLYGKYGLDIILDLDADLEIKDGDKNTGDLIEEWMNFLKTKFSLND